MELAALYVYALLIGSVPTAYIIARVVKGIDIRGFGSGNVGGSNLFESVGGRWLIPLGLFELFAKGGSSLWIGMYVLDLDRSSILLTGLPLAAIAGNNWSLYLKFTGGRGIAVALGALFVLGLNEWCQLLILFSGIGLGGWFITRSSGVWVYISLLLLPVWSVLLGEPLAVTWFCVGLLGLVTLKRLTSNWNPPTSGVPLREVYFNRLFRDRDVARREDWLERGPSDRRQEQP